MTDEAKKQFTFELDGSSLYVCAKNHPEVNKNAYLDMDDTCPKPYRLAFRPLHEVWGHTIKVPIMSLVFFEHFRILEGSR